MDVLRGEIQELLNPRAGIVCSVQEITGHIISSSSALAVAWSQAQFSRVSVDSGRVFRQSTPRWPVHTKGFGFLFHVVKKSSIAACNSSTLPKDPRRIRLLVSSLNHL